MNITELARILKITPQELRNKLPSFGYDIGQKAIKINRNVANRIIRDWPKIKKQLEFQKKQAEKEAQIEQAEKKVKKKLRIPNFITVKEFAAMADLPVNAVLSELMKSGVFTSLNEKIDFETAWLVGSELGLDIKKQNEDKPADEGQQKKLKTVLEGEANQDLLPRPPVIVVMGHVDHGKTKLLDAIRKTHVVEGEAGGITQHIGAYQAKRKRQLITFIDTPGHEAFTAMRSRGARVADIAILIIAADDGVKPQTTEAYRIIEAAKIPFVVAINKIDRPDANIDKTKQELANQLKLVPEDWGGKTVMVPISALKGEGIDDLLDMVLLLAEAEAKNIKANPNAPAIGTIIESHVNKGAGPVATMLIQNGTLRVGDQLTLNNYNIGKVRALNNYRGKKIESAGPATPAQIIGFKTMPQVGDILDVGEGIKQKLKKTKRMGVQTSAKQPTDSKNESQSAKKLNLIIRGDVLGSVEAIEESLMKINTREVKVNIIHKGLGNITDGDIMRAEATNALIVGFNVKIPPTIEELTREKNIEIVLYRIIYDLINEVKTRLEAILDPTIEKTETGRLKVLAVFKTDNNSQVVGGQVISGKIESGTIIEVSRNDEAISEGKLKQLQSGKENVNLVQKGEECGVEYIGNPIIQAGDILTFFKETKITKNL